METNGKTDETRLGGVVPEEVVSKKDGETLASEVMTVYNNEMVSCPKLDTDSVVKGNVLTDEGTVEK